MANHISPAAQLFRGMADLIDHDHTSHTDYEAVTRAAEALAARASTQQLVAGPLWQADGTSLLAAAYAFHAGLPAKPPPPATSRRSSRPAQRRPMVASKPLPATPSRARQVMLQVGRPGRCRPPA
jgi:hypothetical protein